MDVTLTSVHGQSDHHLTMLVGRIGVFDLLHLFLPTNQK